MKTVIIDIETIRNEEAAARCGYALSDEFAPFPLHTVVCASYLAVVSKGDEKSSYNLESFSQGTMSERGIIMSLEAAVEDADVVITFNGFDFDLRVLLVRAALHELYIPRLLDLLNRSRVGKHIDLFDQLKRAGSPTSLAQICAPFAIPVKQEPINTVAELVRREDWAALERYCESDVLGCWLASMFWNKLLEPGEARAAWRHFAAWAAERASEYPSVVAFTTVPEPPRQSYPARGFDDLYF